MESVLDKEEFKGKKIVYLWDFGDNWEHVITVKGRGPASDAVELLAGRGHTPQGDWPFEIKVFRDEDKERINHQLAKYKVKGGSADGSANGSAGDDSGDDESDGGGSTDISLDEGEKDYEEIEGPDLFEGDFDPPPQPSRPAGESRQGFSLASVRREPEAKPVNRPYNTETPQLGTPGASTNNSRKRPRSEKDDEGGPHATPLATKLRTK